MVALGGYCLGVISDGHNSPRSNLMDLSLLFWLLVPLLLPDRSRVIESIAISMDLDESDVLELINRAQHEWDSIKARTIAPATAG